jgi:hypothetical protein
MLSRIWEANIELNNLELTPRKSHIHFIKGEKVERPFAQPLKEGVLRMRAPYIDESRRGRVGSSIGA